SVAAPELPLISRSMTRQSLMVGVLPLESWMARLFPVMLTRGAAPLPKAPIRPGPLTAMVAAPLEANVSPRRNRMRLRLAMLPLIAASKSLLVRTAAAAGQPPEPATGAELPTQ